MRGPSPQARLSGIDYPHFPENLGVAEPIGSGATNRMARLPGFVGNIIAWRPLTVEERACIW
jgi:hypothetical protein